MRARYGLLAAMFMALMGAVARVSVQGPVQSPGPGARDPDLFELKRVTDGVYAAIAKPAYKINSNAVVVVLDDGVLVVDTHSKPSAARGLMSQIKTITTKPIKYVVDTHFHWDHAQGAAAYPAAWPQGLQIISSDTTRQDIEQRLIPRVKRDILDLPKQIEMLRANLAKATEVRRQTELQNDIRQADAYLAELRSMQVTLPSLTFDRSLVIHDKSRTVQLLWLGKAHTDGDIFVYLPSEKFLATGDALHWWTPYMVDSHPYDWVRTLKAVEALDFDTALGGHGDVMRGKAHLQAWQRYLTDLMSETAKAYAAGASSDDAVTTVSALLAPKYAADMPPTFKADLVGGVRKAYRVVSGQTQ